MITSKLMRNIAVSLLIIALSGCATQPAMLPPHKERERAPVQKMVPLNQAEAEWQVLGVSPDGNLLNELDVRSLVRSGNKVTFRGRKTIFIPEKMRFEGIPAYKIALNTWQIDCAQKTFLLLNMALYDQNERQIAFYSHQDGQDSVKPRAVETRSASYEQMKWVCDEGYLSP